MIDKSFLHYLSYRIFVQMRGLLQQYTIVIYYSSMLLQYSSTPIFDLRADRDAVRLAYYYSSILAREAPAIWLDEHMYVIIGKDKRGKKVTQTAIKNTENRKNQYIGKNDFWNFQGSNLETLIQLPIHDHQTTKPLQNLRPKICSFLNLKYDLCYKG